MRAEPARATSVLTFFVLISFAIAQAQTSDDDVRRAAEKISAMQKEAQYWDAHGDKVEALRLREEAQKVWSATAARLSVEIERKHRAEDQLRDVQHDERVSAIADNVRVAADAWKSGKAAAEWLSECAEGPEVCLLRISKAKTAIEKGFDAAGARIDANVHAETASYADRQRATKEAERAALEGRRDSIDGLADRIDYPTEATSHPTTAPSLPIGGEHPGEDASDRGKVYWDATRKAAAAQRPARTGSAPVVDGDDYAAATDAARSQGTSAEAANDGAPAKRAPEFEYDGEFRSAAEKENARVKGNLADAQRAFADEKRDFNTTDRQLRDSQHPSVVVVPASSSRNSVSATGDIKQKSKADDSKKKEKASAAADHCPNGVFKCPNGRPWPSCTHAEKYKCPPPEYANEARKHKAN